MARRTKADALQTRAALLDAAERLFQQRGVSRTSLAQIAQAAGVTRGALYWHFEDKAALFNAMLDRVTLPLSANLADIAEHAEDPLGAWLVHVQDALQRIVSDDQTRRVVQITMQKVELASEMGAAAQRHIQLRHARIAPISHILQRAAQRADAVLPAPTTNLAYIADSLIGGLVYNWLLDLAFDLVESGQLGLLTFLAGAGLSPSAPS